MEKIWKIEWDSRALKELKKLDKTQQLKILDFLRKKISIQESPTRFGKKLKYNKKGLWRYRINDARIICLIEKETFTVLILRIGHRKEIYKDK